MTDQDLLDKAYRTGWTVRGETFLLDVKTIDQTTVWVAVNRLGIYVLGSLSEVDMETGEITGKIDVYFADEDEAIDFFADGLADSDTSRITDMLSALQQVSASSTISLAGLEVSTSSQPAWF